LYTKLGFAGDREIIRLLRPAIPADPGSAEDSPGLRPITAKDMEAIVGFDTKVSGEHRRDVLRNFFDRLPQGAWMQTDDTGQLLGFVLGRDGRIGVQLGPVVANTAEVACRLLDRALANVAGPVVIDAPGEAAEWRARLRER